MGAKTWRAPTIALAEKPTTKKPDAGKQKKAEAAVAKAFDKEASKIARKRIVEAGRLIVEEQKDEYLARLKSDVAKLEAKQTVAPTQGKKEEEKEATKQADLVDKAKKMGEQVLAKQRIEKQRQELFAQSAGPYSLGGMQHKGLPIPTGSLHEQMKSFKCTEAATLPGLLATFEPLDNARALQLPDLATLTEAELPAAQTIIGEAAQALQDELIRYAIQEYGANALVSFRVEGPIPIDDPELVLQGYIYELVASGIPAVVDTSGPAGGAPKLKPFIAPQPAQGILKPTFLKQPSMPQHHVGFADSPLFGYSPFPMTPKLPHQFPPYAGWPPTSGYHSGLPPSVAYPYEPYPAPPLTPWHDPYLSAPRQPFGPLYNPKPTFPPHLSGPPAPPVPPELANLPWGAQMYVKRIRAMQEEEERERERAAAAAVGRTGGAGTGTGAGVGELPKLPLSRARSVEYALILESAAGGIGAGYFSSAAAPAPTIPLAPLLSVDPDHGGYSLGFGNGPAFGGAAGAGAGAGPSRVVPSKENGWKGAQPW